MLLHSQTFKYVMYAKFFMVIFVWGLTPLLIPLDWLAFFGLHPMGWQVLAVRLWGGLVLLDTFVYLYIYTRRETKSAQYLMLLAVLDNAGIGLVLAVLSVVYRLPWGMWANVPFLLFFGYWFWRFYQASVMNVDKTRRG